MKKLTTLLLVTCIFLTGCSKTSLKEVQKNLETAKNYKAKVSISITGTFNGETMKYGRTKNVNIDNINGTAKIDAKVKLNDEKEKDETYYIKTVNKTATTYKRKMDSYESFEEEKDQNSLYYVTAFVNENTETVQEENLKGGKKQYVLNLKQDRAISFLNSYYDVEILSNNEYKVINDVMLKIIVNKKGEIEKLEADFKDCLKYTNINSEINEFKLLIEYSNFNTAGEVNIPEEFINNSLDSNLVKIRQYAYEYVKEVNDLKLGNTTMTNTLGYTISEAELTVINNKVNKGYIKSENYIIEIIDGELGIPKKVE